MRIAALTLSVALLAGCATAPQQNPEVTAFFSWVNVTQPRAMAGEIKFSDFYTQAYDRVAATRVPDKAMMMKAYADLIPIARRYEAGQISRAEFDDARRAAQTSVAQQSQAAQTQMEQARAATALEALRSIPPVQPPQITYTPVMPSPVTHCTTTRGLGSLETTCR